MSQTAQTCTQCGALIDPGQRFCGRCGAPAPQPADPATVESGYNQQSASPSNPGNPTGPSNPGITPPPAGTTDYNYPDYSDAPLPSYMNENQQTPSSPYTQYNTPSAPPPPTPYQQPAFQQPVFPQQPSFQQPYYPVPPVKTTTRPAWFVPLMVIIALVVIVGAGAGIWSLANKGKTTGTNTGGGNGNPSNYADKQTLNLKAYYSSVEITFTSLEQKNKFDDDTFTSYTYGSNKNWVRLNFKENLPDGAASYGAIYSYRTAFSLLLPDGQVAKGEGAKDYTGPKTGEVRDEWVDFGTKDKVDLANLKLRLGGSDEAQMEFALSDNADLSKYNPKSITPNTQFKYATMDWKLTKVTQALYYGGDQAKKNQVFIIVDLEASNNTDEYIFLSYNFLRLKAGENTTAPASGSKLSDLDYVQGRTTGVKGTGVFAVTQTPDNKYTLVFPSDKNNQIAEVDQAIQL